MVTSPLEGGHALVALTVTGMVTDFEMRCCADPDYIYLEGSRYLWTCRNCWTDVRSDKPLLPLTPTYSHLVVNRRVVQTLDQGAEIWATEREFL